MSILGLVTAVYPNMHGSNSKWAVVAATLGILCNISSVPLYLKVSKMWSALLSFVGSGFQGIVLLELVVSKDRT